MFGDTPTVNQRLPAPSRLSIRTRVTASVPPREDAHLVIDEVEVLDEALIAAEILAQRLVERIHRAVALPDRHHRLAVDAHLDGRLRHGDEIADRVVTPLDHDAERIRPRRIAARCRACAARAARRRLRPPRRRSLRLALLHLVEQARDAWIVLRRRRCRCAPARRGCSSGRPGPKPESCAGCRPLPAAHARRCAGPSAPPRHGCRLYARRPTRRHRARAGWARGSASRRACARHGSACGACPA